MQNICTSSWQAPTVCYIPAAFAYDIRLLLVSLQETTFHIVKGCLSTGEKPRFTS